MSMLPPSLQPLQVFISSRCNDTFMYQSKNTPLTKLRVALKKQLEDIRLGGQQVFKVWIHEDESNSAAVVDNWDTCIRRARMADVFIVLYNGRAGWLGGSGGAKNGIGICHAELSAAFDKSPSKVRSIYLTPLVSAKAGSPDLAFQQYVTEQSIPGAQVVKGEDLLTRADELAAAIVLDLARQGVGANATGSYFAGEALQWSRSNFQRRRSLMADAVMDLLGARGAVVHPGSAKRIAGLQVRDMKIGFVCDAVPAAMTTPSARELVGQPFLDDHTTTEGWGSELMGPVHVIACQKNVTEAQAVRQLGFPDAIVVSAPFGIYVADDVQKIQMAFIANCRDETTTQRGVQAFLQWLENQGEGTYLAKRAAARRRISDFVREVGSEARREVSVQTQSKPASRRR